MNILREIRKVKKRSLGLRIFLIIFFATFLITSTFAWFSVNKRITTGTLGGVVTPWNIEFYIKDSDVPLEKSVTFTVDEMYPGMPRFEDYIFIRNIAETESEIEFTLKSVSLFGELIYSNEDIDDFTNELEPTTSTTIINNERMIKSGNVTLIDMGEEYPFTISYSYDKDRVFGTYISDGETPDAVSTFTMNIDWDYELLENGILSQDRDNLDTEFGQRAYEFYNSIENNEDVENAIVIEIEVKATRIGFFKEQ